MLRSSSGNDWSEKSRSGSFAAGAADASIYRLATSGLICLCLLSILSGCYAPLRSPGIPACTLPDSYRYPYRTLAEPLNYATLTVPPPVDYILGANDVLDVTVPDLFPGAEVKPLRLQIMASGEIFLPQAGKLKVGGMNLLQAQEEITAAYAADILVDPRINVALFQKNLVEIVVLGEVNVPGVVALPNFQNDVGHALAAAGGLSDRAADYIEVHRRTNTNAELLPMPTPDELTDNAHSVRPASFQQNSEPLRRYDADALDPKTSIRIPLRGLPAGAISQEDVILNPGDVVVVPNRKYEVFWVVGKLDEARAARFSLGDRERELGVGLVLPSDRDIDVVTAVAMAGYIDPIDSPTTVTVQRTTPLKDPILIRVDLIKARSDRRETVMVQPGDIIYLNPDAHWWMRRELDRIADELILLPYAQLMIKAIR